MTDVSMTPDVPVAQPTDAAAPVIPSKVKVKIDGSDDEVDLEDLKRDYQKFRSSEKRFQEASELRKQAQQEAQLVAQFLEKAQSGDLSWLKGIVPDEQIRKFAESELLAHIDWESKSDIERRAIMAEREQAKLQKQIEDFTQTKEREEASKVEEQAYREIEGEIVEALKGHGYDYKVTPRLIRRISEQMLASLSGEKPMPAKDALQRSFNGLRVDARELLSILPLEEALELLPPKLKAGLRKADLQETMDTLPRVMRQKFSKGTDDGRPRKPKRMDTDRFFDKLEKRFG